MSAGMLPPTFESLGDAATRVVEDVTDEFYGVVPFDAGLLTFSAWLRLVDDEVIRITSLHGGVGLGREDFADWHYADAFEDGIEPDEAAREMLADDDIGAGLLELAGIEVDL